MAKKSKIFKIGFDINDYYDILPDLKEYVKQDEVMNANAATLEECVWRVEPDPEIITADYVRQEVNRILNTGFWFILKGMYVWLPPNYYFFLKYFNTGGMRPDFRLSRLISVYEKIRVRNNPRALGTLVVKSRQIGETTMEMSDLLWEAASIDYGMLGIQSKTRKTVIESCWRTLIMGWGMIPKWLKNAIYPEYISGDKTAETMKFIKQSESGNDKGKNVLITFAAGSHNAFDSVNNMRALKMDEWLKWTESSPYATFLNYEKFIATGTSRKGLFSIFSSPADMETPYIQETYDFWKGSDPAKINSNGTTDTRIVRLYTSPLMGIAGFYDIYGDADANKIYEHIMQRRKSVPKEYRMGEIRAFPLDESEIFGSFEGGQIWDNHKGIVERKVYVMNTRFKNNTTKEPARIYGNLEWKDGVKDSDVVFRAADTDQFDIINARFVVAYPQMDNEILRYDGNGIPMPPPYIESCLGIDPIDKRYVTSEKGFSNAAMVNWKFRDLRETGIVKCPTLGYSCRPSHSEIFMEDAIKAAVYTRSMVQVESINSKIIDYFEDRGYAKSWMLSKRGQPQNSMIKGDAPSGRGMYLTEIMGLINAVTNTPLNADDPYLLERFWIVEMLEDLLKFNPKETHANDWCMALGCSLLGSAKILHKKVRQPSSLNSSVLDYLLT